jgi:hypothetical protein
MFRGGTVFATSFVLFSSLRQHGVSGSGIQKEMYQYKLLHFEACPGLLKKMRGVYMQ